ncbi:MAG: hypothetical protein K2X07_09695 [Caulobacteraceae bacterium]|nr:hypothetical protein [Caulobacteraceae bacterium]
MTDRFQPILITSQGDLSSVLSIRRGEAGMTCEQLDDHIGFHERYVTKLENPESGSGRRSLWISNRGVALTEMGSLWLQGLGLRLVLVDEATAAELGAAPPPPRPSTAEKRRWSLAARAARNEPSRRCG